MDGVKLLSTWPVASGTKLSKYRGLGHGRNKDMV